MGGKNFIATKNKGGGAKSSNLANISVFSGIFTNGLFNQTHLDLCKDRRVIEESTCAEVQRPGAPVVAGQANPLHMGARILYRCCFVCRGWKL